MFKTTLKVEQVSETDWMLLDDLVFIVDHNKFVVPKGFVTDFASSPWWACSVIPKYGRYTRSVVLHDFLLQGFERKFADRWLKIAMKSENTRTWRARIISFFTKLWSRIKEFF